MSQPMERTAEDVAAILRDLPPDTVVRWFDLHAPLAERVHSAGWLDVQVPLLCDALDWNWVWTVNNPATYEWEGDLWEPGIGATGNPNVDFFQLSLVPDKHVYGAVDLDSFGSSFIEETPTCLVNVGESLSSFDRLHLEEVARGHGTTIGFRDGWSYGAVDALLDAWVSEVVGRDDIRFVYDDSLAYSEASRLAAEWEASAQETYQVGEGIQMTSSAMDELLSLPPEESARLMEEIKKVLGEELS